MISETRHALFERLADRAGHAVLRGVDGTVYEGFILEVGSAALTFEWAPSPFYAQAKGTHDMAPPPFELAFDAIAAYLDESRHWQSLEEFIR